MAPFCYVAVKQEGTHGSGETKDEDFNLFVHLITLIFCLAKSWAQFYKQLELGWPSPTFINKRNLKVMRDLSGQIRQKFKELSGKRGINTLTIFL